jgi:hypothetical protein
VADEARARRRRLRRASWEDGRETGVVEARVSCASELEALLEALAGVD